VLGGSEAEAESYLRRAIEADGRYTNAHLILARLLMKQRRFAEARLHLRAVIEVQQPHYPYSWMHLFKPEAERVLQALPPS
jgi:Tfp pilus assembly protein PilF